MGIGLGDHARYNANFSQFYNTRRIVGIILDGLANRSTFFNLFAVRWGFYIEVILLENLSVTNALRRSSELVRGAWWQVFGTFVLILISSYVVQFIFQISLGTIFIFTKFAGDTDLRGIIEWSILDRVLDSTKVWTIFTNYSYKKQKSRYPFRTN